MTEPRQERDAAEAGHEVVRAHRFELIDVDGRVRAVLGADPRRATAQAGIIEHVSEGDGYGLTVLDRYGSCRISLTTDGPSGNVTLYIDGNSAVTLGVDEPERSSATDPGGYIALYSSDHGDRVLRWLATPDGELLIDRPREPVNEEDV